MTDQNLLTLTADIVSAHVSNNAVPTGDVAGLIGSVYSALATLDAPAPAEPPKAEPAVSIRASVKTDHIVCLECGKKLTLLKRHLSADHGLTMADYRSRWSLPSNYPTVAPAYAEKRSTLAKELGLGRKPANNQASAAKPAKRQAKLKTPA